MLLRVWRGIILSLLTVGEAISIANCRSSTFGNVLALHRGRLEAYAFYHSIRIQNANHCIEKDYLSRVPVLQSFIDCAFQI